MTPAQWAASSHGAVRSDMFSGTTPPPDLSAPGANSTGAPLLNEAGVPMGGSWAVSTY